MKIFFVYFGNAPPLMVAAEAYERKGDYIEFWAIGVMQHLIPAMDVVTIVEEKQNVDSRHE